MPAHPQPCWATHRTSCGVHLAKRLDHHAPQITDLHGLLRRITGGHDLDALPALTDYSVLQLVGEVGTDMSRWPTAEHVTAWLGLAPSSRRSGKRRRREKRVRNAAGQIFSVAARSKHLALGGFCRRLRAMHGGQGANVATARKLAVLFYNTQRYEQACREQCLRRLLHNARHFGLTLVPVTHGNT